MSIFHHLRKSCWGRCGGCCGLHQPSGCLLPETQDGIDAALSPANLCDFSQTPEAVTAKASSENVLRVPSPSLSDFAVDEDFVSSRSDNLHN
ncbi:UNVERIFIED_CONTAM: hypothetical protein HHA_450710 [Hammondia hammondi]|eukprot:XP_008883139.1 hypothetical protein HHA_450710 [Hammondia hammondi]